MMMARPTYKIPTSINRSMLDHEVVISGGGISMKPLPLKVILFWIAAILTTLAITTRTFLADAGGLLIGLFVVWMVIATAFFGQYSKTREMKFQQLPALVNYLPKGSRRVMTRNSSNPYGFMTITGIRQIDPDGLITFVDGGVGQAYSVVGTGSKLLFDGDKDAIIARVKSFWEKVDTDAEWTFITMREPQQITEQVDHAEKLNQRLATPGPYGTLRYPDTDELGHSELYDLLDERYHLLQHVAGVRRDGTKGARFMSIHQYLIIRAATLENLQAAHSVLESEVNASSVMFKQARILDNGAKTIAMLKVLYQGRDKTPVTAAPKKDSLAGRARARRREKATGGLVKAAEA